MYILVKNLLIIYHKNNKINLKLFLIIENYNLLKKFIYFIIN